MKRWLKVLTGLIKTSTLFWKDTPKVQAAPKTGAVVPVRTDSPLDRLKLWRRTRQKAEDLVNLPLPLLPPWNPSLPTLAESLSIFLSTRRRPSLVRTPSLWIRTKRKFWLLRGLWRLTGPFLKRVLKALLSRRSDSPS